VIPLLGIYPKEGTIETFVHWCSSQHYSQTAKLWKQHRCPTTDEWVKKMRYIDICHMEFYSDIRNNDTMWF
jgi:hypothetical protein